MKKQIQKHSKLALVTLALFASTGCSTYGLLAIGSDKTLPKIVQVKSIVSKNSVGFEWAVIKDTRVKGIKVYRAIDVDATEQKYENIATIADRYATHFVDKNIASNKSYQYTFTTYDLLHESLPGRIVKIRTLNAFAPVSFVEGYLSGRGVVKIIWKPHPNPAISGYIIERKVSGANWKYLARVSGRLMPEYIDKSARVGYEYSYRLIARASNGAKSTASDSVSLIVK